MDISCLINRSETLNVYQYSLFGLTMIKFVCCRNLDACELRWLDAARLPRE